MSNPNRKPVNFKSLHIVHAALCAGVILFLITAVFINQQALIMVPANDNSIIIYIAIVMAVVSTILGYILFNIVVSKIDTSVPVNQKLPKYLSACIVRYALIEGGALLM
jgi:drug/metabolite transporter (DMT)-like permease